MLNETSGAPSLSDIAAVTGNGSMSDSNGWWILIILFAIFGGWGNGFGGNRTQQTTASGVTDGYILTSDFASLERKIDGVNNGLCDGFYAMNTGLLNGFSNTNAAIASGFAGVNNAVCQLGYQNAQLINGVNTQMLQMQNSNQQGLSQLRYDMTMQGQQIMQNDNANYRSLHDELVAFQMSQKDEKIAEQQAEIQALNLAASQVAQNNYLVNAIRPSAVPAYVVQNPYSSSTYTCGCNT